MRTPRLSALLVTAALTLGGGAATVIAAPAAGATQASASAAAITAPRITAQPAAKRAYAGTRVVFRVAAVGSAIKYTWQVKRPNTPWYTVSAPNAASLNVEALPSRNAALYRVIVSNSGGRVVSRAAELTVVVAGPRVTTQPTSVSTTSGHSATFSAKGAGYNVRYQWQYRPLAGEWRTIAGATRGLEPLPSRRPCTVGSTG